MAGRPSSYNQKMQAAAEAYVAGGFKKEGDVVPTTEGLALSLGVTRMTLNNWAAAHATFFDTFEALKSTQARLLANGALKGDMNATIAKLMLHNHGYSDKAETDHKSSDGSMTPQPNVIRLVAGKADGG